MRWEICGTLCSVVDGFSATNSTPPEYLSATTLRPRAMPFRAYSERSRISCSGEAYSGMVTAMAPSSSLSFGEPSASRLAGPVGHDGLGHRSDRLLGKVHRAVGTGDRDDARGDFAGEVRAAGRRGGVRGGGQLLRRGRGGEGAGADGVEAGTLLVAAADDVVGHDAAGARRVLRGRVEAEEEREHRGSGHSDVGLLARGR